MSVQTIYDTGSTYDIPSAYDGASYQVGMADCIVGGVGDEFTITYSASSLNVGFTAGSACIIGGSFFRIEANESIALTANSTIYLTANINLANAVGSKGTFAQKTSSNIKKEILNGSGSERDLLLYIITTNANGVTNVQDKRFIIKEETWITKTEFDALSVKDTHTIYHVIQGV